MTANGGAGQPGAADLRALIREVLRDALAAGDLERMPREHPARPLPARADTGAREPLTRHAAPPTEIPAGIVHRSTPSAGALQTSAALPARHSAAGASIGDRSVATAADEAGSTRHVRLETDEDLREFVLTVLRLAENPARRRDLLADRLRFTLREPPGGKAGPAASHAGRATCRIEAGAVTERAVQAAAKEGERLVLGRRAVLTPLARDRALALGVPIERER